MGVEIDTQLYVNWILRRQNMGRTDNTEEDFKSWLSCQIDEMW